MDLPIGVHWSSFSAIREPILHRCGLQLLPSERVANLQRISTGLRTRHKSFFSAIRRDQQKQAERKRLSYQARFLNEVLRSDIYACTHDVCPASGWPSDFIPSLHHLSIKSSSTASNRTNDHRIDACPDSPEAHFSDSL
jgi:hypothetical protein